MVDWTKTPRKWLFTNLSEVQISFQETPGHGWGQEVGPFLNPRLDVCSQSSCFLRAPTLGAEIEPSWPKTCGLAHTPGWCPFAADPPG